jgi:hypothetical protein
MRISYTFGLALVGSMGCYDSDARRPPEQVEESAYEQALADFRLVEAEACCEEAGARGVWSGYRDAVLRGLTEDAPSPDSGARYDPQAAAACLDSLAPLPCWHLKMPFPPARDDNPCARIYRRGNRQLGEECRTHWDCAEHARGDTTCGFGRRVGPDTIMDVCKLQFLVEEGEPCVEDDPLTELYCRWPLLCDPTSERCVARAERGEPCLVGLSWGDTCAAGSVCDRSDTERCIEPIAVGDACEDGERCEGSACVEETCRPASDFAADCEW